MLSNYITTAIRSLLKNRGFSAINILGLSIGLCSFLLITLYVYHEWSFDRYHSKASRIYRIIENLRTENELLLQSTSSPPMGPAMAKSFPEVERFVRMQGRGMLVRKGDEAFFEEKILMADSSIFDVFDFKMLKGDPETALREPRAVVLTQPVAVRYFGDSDPIGKELEMNGELYKVTGVAEEVPLNSHFRFEILISFSTWSVNNQDSESNCWFCNGFHTYLLLTDDPTSATKVQSKMKAFIEKSIPKGGMYYEELPLQPLNSIYFGTARSWENGTRGSKANLYILSAIALFILLIASFNYVNLATARASRRLKEVGLRKVLGAQRRMLILQFVSESVLVSVIATATGVLVAWAILPLFNRLIETELSFTALPTLVFWGGTVGLALVLGLFSGVYPAIVISGFHPLQVFRSSSKGIFSQQYFRKVLVAAQFVISITLVAGTLLVFDQLTMMRTRDLGFTKEATLIIRRSGDRTLSNKIGTVTAELGKVPGVESVTVSHTVPGQTTTNNYSEVEIETGKMSPTNINTNFIDHNYLPAYGIELMVGRNFKPDFPADSISFIVNETAMKDFGWTVDNAVGRKFRQWNRLGTIIGVTRDFNYRSLHNRIEPLMMRLEPQYFNLVSVKIKSSDIPAVVAAVGEKWKELSPGVPYRYTFLEEDYDKLYQADAKLGKVAGVFSGLAIFVGCLGLLGLTSFSVERRVKEIGIRKVLGASSGNVALMISREFVVLVIVAFVVAVPITYYLIDKWLANFIDRINIGGVSFLLAGAAVLVVAWVTVSFLSFKAASANPSESLRNE